jgi:hypothetical protein
VVLLLGACGEELVGRSFELDVRGLSARASSLVVKRVDAPLSCPELDLVAAGQLEADETAQWSRASGEARALTLSPVVADAITLVVYAADDSGTPIQLACRTVTYEELGNLVGGRVVLTLSRRDMASLVAGE